MEQIQNLIKNSNTSSKYIVNFDNAETLETQLMTKVFNQFGITDYSFTPNGSYSRHDGQYTTTRGEKIIFETKVRTIGINDYNTTVIEQSKYEYLLQQELITGKIPYLFVFYPKDNKVFVTRVVEGLNKTSNSCQKQTCGDQTKVTKKLINFPITSMGTITLN